NWQSRARRMCLEHVPDVYIPARASNLFTSAVRVTTGHVEQQRFAGGEQRQNSVVVVERVGHYGLLPCRRTACLCDLDWFRPTLHVEQTGSGDVTDVAVGSQLYDHVAAWPERVLQPRNVKRGV